jgi:SAM-dependent MidA family methyltransferase
MGSSHNLNDTAPSAAFLARFKKACPEGDVLSFERFMEIALYDPEVGYYRQSRPRVGYGDDTDFYTASTSGGIFGELIATAAEQLLDDVSPEDYTFVEIGAESDGGLMKDVPHRFHAVATLPLGAPLAIKGRCVVFSNELFDAQPCRRFIGRAGQWHESGVTYSEGQLIEAVIEEPAAETYLPKNAPEGYRLDAPRAAVSLLEQIASQSWEGLFIACDYGKSWRELTEATPGGTTRAYYRHTQSNDLLARPGDQDLTCHVCWDWLSGTLQKHDFASPSLQSQESFLIHHAGPKIAEISTQEAANLSQRKLALMQLLHPAHLGQKFQVLHASRK